MIWLALTILTSSIIYGIFKVFDIQKVHVLQAISFNYLVCASIGLLTAKNTDISIVDGQNWLIYALILGILFIVLFNLIAKCAQDWGMAVASMADRMGLIIPAGFAIVLYKEDITVLKVVGILLALLSVFLAVSRNNGEQKTKSILLPLTVFFGGGILATLLKHVQITFEQLDFAFFLSILFATAGFIGLIVVSLSQITGKGKKWTIKSVIAGIALGIPNYGSMIFLLKTLDYNNWQSSVIFPVNNIGIVVCSALIGYFAFNETFSRKNLLGIGLAVVAILILLFEQVNSLG